MCWRDVPSWDIEHFTSHCSLLHHDSSLTSLTITFSSAALSLCTCNPKNGISGKPIYGHWQEILLAQTISWFQTLLSAKRERSIQGKPGLYSQMVVFQPPPPLKRIILATMGTQLFDVTLFQTSKYNKSTSNNYFSLLGPWDYAVAKCNPEKVLNSHTHILRNMHRHTYTHTQILSTLTEIHIFLAIPCCILTSNSAFNSVSLWVGISVSWMEPILIQ